MKSIWYLSHIALLLVSLSIAWWVHYQADFFFQLWYGPLGIAENIDCYGRQNRFKRFFADTDKRERLRMFGAINHAVHNRGQGLTGIRYTTPRGFTDTLLHEAETTHLRDVAILIGKLKLVGAMAVTFTLAWIAWLRWRRPPLPGLQRTWFVVLVSLCGFVALLVILGPTHVFYRFHEWMFPVDHQWFFYYQDSLMSTLMKAPDLFGAIAATVLAMAIAIYMLLSWSLSRWLSNRRE